MKEISLDESIIGDILIVKKILTNASIKRRFLDIGLSKNTKVIPMFNSICGGIRAYKIRNSLIGIRDSDAKEIIVRRSNE